MVTPCLQCPYADVTDHRITCTAPDRQGCRLIHPETSDIDLRTEADFDTFNTQTLCARTARRCVVSDEVRHER